MPQRRSRLSPLFPRLSPRVVVVLVLVAVAAYFLSQSQAVTVEPSSVPAATQTAPAAPSASPTAAPSASTADALAMLAVIPVKGRAPKTGYDREGEFGSAWTDVDHNGCDTRNDILVRDLTETTIVDGCRVLAGTLVDPYTASTIAFLRGDKTSALVQIDHIVALSNAWQSGAQQLPKQRRVALANDPLNLVAVDGAANQQKGDGDAATWLPANAAFRCTYVSRQIAVKAAYALWVTAAERDAMERVLGTCPV